MRRTLISAAFLITFAVPPGASADDLVLELPIDCEIGKVCSIEKYFDHVPGPGRMDYACGRLSGDGHDGTDIRLPDFPTMERGIAVLAAAPGVVKALRDGMPDISVRKIGREALGGKDAGNGVLIDHGDGWVTQYNHLKQGSIAVRRGDQVVAGQRLGLVGLSGNTEYPHVELIVRHDGQAIDPFVGREAFRACGDARRPLWSPTALRQLDYRASGPLISGFATTRPDPEAARRGAYAVDRLAGDADALVFWVDIFGALAGDRQRFRIDAPDGRILHDAESVLDASNLSWFAFSGLRRPADGWQPGIYRASYTLERDGQVVISVDDQITVGSKD